MSNQKSYYNPNRKKSHEQITDITATGMHFRSSAKECFFVKRHTRKAPASRNNVTILTAILISPQNAVAAHIRKYERARLIPLASGHVYL